MVLPASGRVSRVPPYSGAIPVALEFRLRGYHPLWPAFPGRSTILTTSRAASAEATGWSYNPRRTTPAGLHTSRLGWSPFARHYWGSLCLIYFPEGTEMFQFPSFAASSLCIQPGATPKLLGVGFPIRRSTDQRLLTAPRGLSQFCHVLHRLLVPRHPPNALTSLTTKTVESCQPSLQNYRETTARTRRQTVKSQSSFAASSSTRKRLSMAWRRVNPPAIEYPRRKRHRRSSSSRAAGMTSWVSCELARPSECLLLATPAFQQGRKRTLTLVFVLHASFNYGVFNASQNSSVGSSGPGKT